MVTRSKILVADDSSSLRHSIQKMLDEDNNYNLLMANNGREACTMAYHERPDLILIDIEMPIMNGIEAICKIKGNTLIKRIPIIVMSSTKKFQEAFSAGANDFLIKPFNKYELLMRIQLNLRLAQINNEFKKQHDLLKSQKQEAISQHNVILKQQTDLMDNLNYAWYVQNAILPSSNDINLLFSDHFVYNRPKNIVSGDFYWVTKSNNLIIIAVGDCTGHGMSGALMTMAGAAFLNEIVGNSQHSNADQILNDLRKKVVQLLNQKGAIGEASNGMDIALCIYNEDTQTLQFAGANNPIYLVRKDGCLEVIKGDRMPIGYFFQYEQPFTKTEFQISKGDSIYLFTDGYADQFGGPYEKKFRYNQFKELLANATSAPSMAEVHQLVKTTMEEWIEGYEQIDDMLVMGVRF
jgi:serine phosphatase RsbU (regulator of sigma subunit)